MNKILIILVVAAYAVMPAGALTINFNNMDFTGSEIAIYNVTGSGVEYYNTIKTNETVTLNGSQDYVFIVRPEKMDILKNPKTFGDYFQSLILVIILLGAFGTFMVVMYKAIRGRTA